MALTILLLPACSPACLPPSLPACLLSHRAREGHKRKATDQAGRDPKQARPGTPAAADSSAGNTPTRTPTPTPGPGAATPSSGGGGVEMPTDLMALFRPGPGANLVEALNNAQQVLEVLVLAQQEEAVQVREK